jgi:hypothetical protein
MKPDWQEAAVHVMFASVSRRLWQPWWRKIGYDIGYSSAICFVVVHAWVQRVEVAGQGRFRLFCSALAVLLLRKRALSGHYDGTSTVKKPMTTPKETVRS